VLAVTAVVAVFVVLFVAVATSLELPVLKEAGAA
jgi:hypothetical protein